MSRERELGQEETQEEFLSFLGAAGVALMLSDDLTFQDAQWRLFDTETYRAFVRVFQRDPDWIKKVGKLNCSDKVNVRSYLGELRAYDDLLQLPWFNIVPKPRKKGGTDFEVIDKVTKQTLKVEVYTQCSKPYSAISEKGVKSWISETVVTPLMNWCATLCKVAPSEISVTKGTIRSIGAGKRDAHQVDPTIPTYLYIDFQQIWGLGCEQALPIMSQSEFLTTGAFWMAFYGKKGMPIIENFSFDEPITPSRMDCDGLFFRSPSNGFAGALLRCRRNGENPLVFFENPQRGKTPRRFLCSLLQSSLMNVEKSCWSYSGVASKVKRENARIVAVVNNVKRIRKESMRLGVKAEKSRGSKIRGRTVL